MTAGIAGRVALVTGAAQGIGAEVARTLAGHGATVALADLSDAAPVAKELDARAYTVDVRDTASVETLVEAVERDLGPIGLLVNVAGVLRVGRLTELTDEDWAAVFDVNTHGVFRVCRAVGRRMAQRRSGTIVTVGSNAGGVPRMAMGAYAASKAATAHLMRCLGLELAGAGVRCNVVAPGSTDTAMQRSLWTDDHGAEAVVRGDPAQFKVGIPLGRLAQPRDIADAVAFLASDAARHITMQVLDVDGGAALRV